MDVRNLVNTEVADTNLSKIFEGVIEASKIIGSTMGGAGRNVIFTENGEHRFTKDGVTVAQSIFFKDPQKRIGANLVKAAAEKTVSEVGDGTTATSVLLGGIIEEYERLFKDTLDMNQFVKGLEKARDEVLTILKAGSLLLETNQDILNIASVASNSNRIGSLIASCYEEVGKDSLVTLEQSEFATESYYEVLHGLDFNSGYISEQFANTKSKQVIYKDAAIIVEEQPLLKITSHVKNVMGETLNSDTPLIVIAPEFSNAVIRTFIMNKSRGLKTCLIKTPGYGRSRSMNIRDITAYTDDGMMVDKIVVTPVSFTIYNTNPSGLKERISELEAMLKTPVDDYEYKADFERLHKLKGSTAIIYAGGQTLDVLKEEYDRIEDALGSVKAAIKGGYVSGGGSALARATTHLNNTSLSSNNTSFKEGVKIIYSVCTRPLERVIGNTLLTSEEASDIFQKVISTNTIFDVKQMSFIDSYGGGIIDPLPVVEESLKNAVSTAILLLRTSYVIINKLT